MVLNSSLHFKINFESVKKLCWHFAIFSNRMLRQKEMMVGDCRLATVISKTASWYLFLVTVIRLVQVYLNVCKILRRAPSTLLSTECWYYINRTIFTLSYTTIARKTLPARSKFHFPGNLFWKAKVFISVTLVLKVSMVALWYYQRPCYMLYM